MRPRRRLLPVLVALSSALLAACESGPKKTPHEHARITPEVLSGFRDLVYARYELRIVCDPLPVRGRNKRDLDVAEQAEKDAREKLVQALEAAGSTDARAVAAEKSARLDAIVLGALARTRRYGFVLSDDGATFAVVRLAREPEQREVKVFGQDVSFELYVLDETVIDDFPTYSSRRLSPGGAGGGLFRPAFLAGRADERGNALPNAPAVYVDVALIDSLGAGAFFARTKDLAATAKAAQDDAFFAKQPNDALLLQSVKDVLRYRSLESFLAIVEPLRDDEKRARFVSDYEARALVSTACELQELGRARDAGDPHPTGDRRAAVEKRALLSAIIHGEALGEAATAVGLAARRANGASPDPLVEARLRAAVSVTVDLEKELARVARARENEDDAAAFGRLARAPADSLKAAAKAIYEKLPPPAAPGAPPGAPPVQAPPR
ncbi:hypothetical protein HY251_11045 [bacterium]|nr:hypothetical protein [bacterium]